MLSLLRRLVLCDTDTVYTPVGFIAPGSSVNITISIDPQLILRSKNPDVRVLPTRDTHDSIYLDFSVVPAESYAYLENWSKSGRDSASISKQVQDDASLYWKHRGPAVSASQQDTKKIRLILLHCVKNCHVCLLHKTRFLIA